MEPNPNALKPNTLTVQEAAELLNLSPSSVRAAITRGDIPGRRIGRTFRVHRASLEAFIAGQDRRRQERGDAGWS